MSGRTKLERRRDDLRRRALLRCNPCDACPVGDAPTFPCGLLRPGEPLPCAPGGLERYIAAFRAVALVKVAKGGAK